MSITAIVMPITVIKTSITAIRWQISLHITETISSNKAMQPLITTIVAIGTLITMATSLITVIALRICGGHTTADRCYLSDQNRKWTGKH